MQYIEVKQKQSITEIFLNNQEKRNALNQQMIQELTTAFTQVSDSRLIILSGNGASFCAGADLVYMQSMKDFSHEENVADSKELANLFYTMTKHSLPIVAKAHGHVFGGGLGLLAACDVIFAQKDTQFCFSEVKLGLAPAVISPFTLARIGFTHARRYFLTGEVFTSDTAKNIGLINEIYQEDADVANQIAGLTKRLLSGGPEAQATIKSMTNDLIDLSKNDTANKLAELISQLRVSPEGQEGISAFFAKRKPSWIK